MGDRTGIEWSDATWNPVTGCTKVSPGCDNCYAETIAHRFAGTDAYPDGFAVTLRPERLDQPLRWRRPRRVFVNSMSDLFHQDVPDAYIARVFAVMALAPAHTFQVLTKRHARMRSLLSRGGFRGMIEQQADELVASGQLHASREIRQRIREQARHWVPYVPKWPLPNVELVVSVEDQRWAEIRIPALLDTPAAVRGVSCEPLLGPVEIDRYVSVTSIEDVKRGLPPLVDWVIVGGESGPRARPMHPDWARSLRDQCQAAGVPFFFKQWGEWIEDVTVHPDGSRTINVPPDGNRDRRRLAMHPGGMTAMKPDNRFNPFRAGHPHWTAMRRVGKKAAGRELDGREWDEYPERRS